MLKSIKKVYAGIWMKLSQSIQRENKKIASGCHYCWKRNSRSESDSLFMERECITARLSCETYSRAFCHQLYYLLTFGFGQVISPLLISVTWSVLHSSQVYCRDQIAGMLSKHSESHTTYYKIYNSELVTIYCKRDFISKEEKRKGRGSKTGKGLEPLRMRNACHCQQIALKTRAQGHATKKYFGEVVKPRSSEKEN